MLTNVRQGLNLCFTSPAYYYLAAVWLPFSLLIARDMHGYQALITWALLIVMLASLGRWLRDLAEHGAQARPDEAPCTPSRALPATSLSWTNIRNGIHLAVRTGHSDMHASRPIVTLALLLTMVAWYLSGNSTLLVEAPVTILAMSHLGLYAWEIHAVGAHADMDTVEYDEDGRILGYIRKHPAEPTQD